MTKRQLSLTLGLNLLWLRPGAVGGTETYARRVLRALASTTPEVTMHLFGTKPGIEAVAPTKCPVVQHEAAPGAIAPTRRVFVEKTWFRSSANDAMLDVLHHLGGTVPFAFDGPSVVTIHDLQPLDEPENFSATKVRFLRRAIPAAIDRATVVTTPSDWVREQVIERFDADPASVLTVSAFAEPVDLAAPAQGSTRIERLRSQGPILLFPAMTLNHKNHHFLFEAFADAVRREPDLQLVCVGAIGRDHEKIRARASWVSPRIHMLGYVTKGDLDALYRAADALVFPSRFEGFGLPILEAQHYGVPVISSNATALGEVAGGGAVLLDPDDRSAWADTMVARFTPEERARLVSAGFANARRYSLEATAEQQRCAYRLATA